MKLLRTLVAPLLAVTVVAGCGDSNGPGTSEATINALAGTWNATSMVFTNNANSSETYDLIADGGSLSLTFTAAGGFSGSSTTPEGTEILSGTFVVQGTNLIVTDTGEPESETIAFTLSGNTLTLTLDDELDFDDDGFDEPATLVIVLQRA